MRIQLKPGLQLITRGPATVQIGLDGRHGAVLDGLGEPDLELLNALTDGVDGALLTGVVPADRAGADRALRARRLVQTLTGTGTLLRSRSGRAALARVGTLRPRLSPDAAAWSLVHPRAGDGWELLAARRAHTVEIRGSGRTGTVLAAALAAAGVGTVLVRDDGTTVAADLAPGGAVPADLGLPRSAAARNAVDRALGHDGLDALDTAGRSHGSDDSDGSGRAAGTGESGQGAPDLVVLLDRAAADAARADPLLAADVAHLSVVVRETSVIVGPLVVPGRGPCLRCLDLHRSERDRQWPMVLAQLLGRQGRRSVTGEETTLAQLAAGLAALQVLAQLDGQAVPASLGATLEVELPDGLVSRRPWPAHASCGCHWPPGLPVRSGGVPDPDHGSPDPGQDERVGAGPATMTP